MAPGDRTSVGPLRGPTVTGRGVVVAAAWWAAAIAAYLLVIPVTSSGDAAVSFPPTGSASWWVGLLLVTVQGACLVVRTARPRAVLVAVAVVMPVGAVCGLADAIGVTSLAVVAAAYTAGRLVPIPALRTSAPGAGVLVATGQLLDALRLDTAPLTAVGAALLQALGIVGVPVAIAVFVVARRDARQAREGQLLAVAREREARLEATVSHERMAMARELHDIAAHHLSGIAVMTAAIGPQIDTDPAGAKIAVGQVREQSRALLRDLRSLVGLLREAPGRGDLTGRQQTLAGITELVDDASRAGTVVELSVLTGASEPLGAGVGPLAQLAAYRIVQESLTNAARHAPGAPCRVVVDDRGRGELVITVVNPVPGGAPGSGPAEGNGFGLVGMRERAELTGSDLQYGHRPDGTWQVRLTVPRDVARGSS